MSFTTLVSLFIVALACYSADAFVGQSTSSRASCTELGAFLSRRNMFGALVAAGTAVATSQPANASYSAYANREKDWEERNKSGEVQFSDAKTLRAQLREIVPQNSEASKLFCPNGPSANVSPLMENKCGDALAMPSVYGRTQDTVGNSIPGFSGGRYPSNMVGAGSESINELGGFPAYQRDVRSK